MIPNPKYKIGDKVFAVGNSYSNKCISCPDCLGTKEWIITFADGESLAIECQTCRNGFYSASGLIYYNEWQASTRILTIGQIYGWSPDEGTRYMCEETGIGSGTIHKEDDLFVSQEEAAIKAEEKLQEQMKHIARNNFSKKFKGKKQIEQMLSTFGFTRRQKLEKARKFVQWAKLSGVIKGV